MKELFKNCKNSKQQGNIGHIAAMLYYSTLGWNISNPITDSNEYDFIVEDTEGNIKKVSVKTTRYLSDAGNYVVSLATDGGNRKEYWSKKLDRDYIDLIFIVTELGDCYSIPTSVLDSNKSLTLYSKYLPYKVMTFNTNIILSESFKKETIEYYCLKCGKKVSKEGNLCKKCAASKIGESKRKVERPDKETLLKQLSETNMTKVGELYGVSDKAISKWLIAYELPGTIKELKNRGLI